MNNALVFDFDGEPVRWEYEHGEILGRARDLCRCLAIETPQRAYDRIPDDEKVMRRSGTLGGEQATLWLREAGIYRLIFESRKPAAERFKKWVFSEVLPAIRRTGRYDGRPDPGSPAFEFSPEHGDWQAKASLVREARMNFGRAAGRALWIKLGLPPVTAEEIAAVMPAMHPPVAAIVKALLLVVDRAGGYWTGTPTALLDALRATGGTGLPETGQALGTLMDRVGLALRLHDISVSRIHSGERRYVIQRGPAGGTA